MLRHYPILARIILSIIWLTHILSWAIIINSLLSWVLAPVHPIRIFLGRLVEPIMAPFRALYSKLNTSDLPVDLSPMLAYFALFIIRMLLNSLL